MTRQCAPKGMVFLLGTLVLAASSVLAQTNRTELLRQSDLIFSGTVEQVGNSTLADVPPSPNTIVVRVSQVLDKPKAVSLAKGHLVTVHTKDASGLRRGVHALFYTKGMIYGKSIAVREIGRELRNLRGAAAANIGNDIQREARRVRRDTQRRALLATADVVIVGRVKEVRQPSVRALQARSLPITEHAPDWREAVVEVRNTLKGANVGDSVVVRFPSSIDVAWFRTPKLNVGQSGTFILERDATSGVPRAVLNGVQVPAYTALNPLSVVPDTEAERIRNLMPKKSNLRSELDAADAIIVGTVQAVREPKQPPAGQRVIVTEHAGQWLEAVVQVESVLKTKDQKAGDTVIIRFPTSKDVAWVGAPRLKTGQKGTFILQADNVSGVPKPVVNGVEVPAYTALQPASVMPARDAVKLEKMLR